MMDIKSEVHSVLKEIGPGKMSAVAYDTAWIAFLRDHDRDLSDNALAWLREHQLKDGSWGMEKPFGYHDRVVNTLAAMVALAKYGEHAKDHRRVERGLLALDKITDKAFKKKMVNSDQATVGFEMIVPVLMEEAQKLGLINSRREAILGQLSAHRKIKLKLLEGRKINRHLSSAHCVEMAGFDGLDVIDVDHLGEKNGSIGHSPSATAYYLAHIKPDDTNALSYLHKFATPSGGALDAAPFEVFEASWVLWNFSLLGEWDEETMSLLRPWLDYLKKGWVPAKGIGLSTGYSVSDGDDTSMTFSALARFGTSLDVEAVLSYEEKDRFRTFQHESNSSNSVNIHALDALRAGGLSVEFSSIQKILTHLQQVQGENAYWYDKWHISPYYTTAHAIIACAGYADYIVQSAVKWIIETQRSDGSWGLQFSSAEETAYCLQALYIWQRHGGRVSKSALRRGTDWLKDHSEPPYPPLWIAKALYTPELIVRSAISSALLLAEKG